MCFYCDKTTEKPRGTPVLEADEVVWIMKKGGFDLTSLRRSTVTGLLT